MSNEYKEINYQERITHYFFKKRVTHYSLRITSLFKIFILIFQMLIHGFAEDYLIVGSSQEIQIIV